MDLYQIFPIHTARLTIQILTIYDAFALQTITNHPEITNIVDILATPFTLDDARQLLMNAEQQSHFFLGVYFHHQKELTAVIGIHPQPSQNVEIGYWVSPDYQRQKIAYEALTAILPKIKTSYPYQEIIAECLPENQASWNLLVKVGFKANGQAGHRKGRKLLIHA